MPTVKNKTLKNSFSRSLFFSLFSPVLTADKATGEKSIVAGKSVTIVDTVTLDGLKKGTNDCLS